MVDFFLNLSFFSSGVFSGARNLAKCLGLLGVLPLVHFLGLGDPIIAAGSTCFRMVGYIIIAFARTTLVMFSGLFMTVVDLIECCNSILLYCFLES